ncbi:MAG: TIR domain-containing protein [Pseudomonadota bacterium]
MEESARHVFLSYAAADTLPVQRVVSLLRNRGWPIWWDQEQLLIGERPSDTILQAIEDASCVVVFWSSSALESNWVLDEAEEAQRASKLVPVRLEDVMPPLGLRQHLFVDLFTQDQEAEARLLAHIEARLEADKASLSPHGRHTPLEIPSLLNDPHTEPKERAAIGDRLARLGDLGPGVGLSAGGLPDIGWCKVPSGTFSFGDALEPIEIDEYYMARFPVTNAQFQTFIEDGGYDQDAWWEDLDDRAPASHGRWNVPNRPRERVLWCEAVAYCRWLSKRLGYRVRLPTEHEWEKAARGQDARIYPWGDQYEAGYAHVDESGAGISGAKPEETIAVGLFPHGASPYGVEDMSGNVWEWCANEYGSPQRTQISGDAARSLRGGSWQDLPFSATNSYRFWYFSGERHSHVGFRVCCSCPVDAKQRRGQVEEAKHTRRKTHERGNATQTIVGKRSSADYDVFLCHNSEDKEEVERIGRALIERGILPWLDKWDLRPGYTWQEAIEAQIEAGRAAAIIVGDSGFGQWHTKEMRAFISEYLDRELPVIPVLLPTAQTTPTLPIFLRDLTWVDFREVGAIDRLVWGITGDKSGTPMRPRPP